MAQEAKFQNAPHITGNGKLFRDDRPSYKRMYEAALNQNEMFEYTLDDESIQDCACTD